MSHPPILTTSRLILRPLTIDDVSALHEAFSDEETCRYTSNAPHINEDETQARIEKIIADTVCYEWAITTGTSQPASGTVGLYPSRTGVAGLGYMLRRDACGHGYAREAVEAVLAHGFETMELRRIYADIDPDNTASIRLAERCGMMLEGHLKANWETHIGIRDSLIYAIVRTLD